MSISYNWTVYNTTRETSTGKIVEVSYSVLATDEVYTATAQGNISLEGEVTIPYSEVTEEICLGWALDALANSVEVKNEEGEVLPFTEARTALVASIENRLAAEISEQAAPQFANGLPWGEV